MREDGTWGCLYCSAAWKDAATWRWHRAMRQAMESPAMRDHARRVKEAFFLGGEP